MFIFIAFWFGRFRPPGLLFSFMPVCLLTFFVCFFILFHSCCSHARVFGKARLHEFHISHSYIEWCLLFFRQCNYKCTMCIRSEKLELVKHSQTWTTKLNLLWIALFRHWGTRSLSLVSELRSVVQRPKLKENGSTFFVYSKYFVINRSVFQNVNIFI